MIDALEPGSEHRATVRGYEVIARTAPDDMLHVTCPELPQLNLRDKTLTSALACAEDAIAAIWAGEFEKPERTA